MQAKTRKNNLNRTHTKVYQEGEGRGEYKTTSISHSIKKTIISAAFFQSTHTGKDGGNDALVETTTCVHQVHQRVEVTAVKMEDSQLTQRERCLLWSTTTEREREESSAENLKERYTRRWEFFSLLKKRQQRIESRGESILSDEERRQ